MLVLFKVRGEIMTMAADYTVGKLVLAIFAVACAWQDLKTMSISHSIVTAGFIMAFLGMLATVYAGCLGKMSTGAQAAGYGPEMMQIQKTGVFSECAAEAASIMVKVAMGCIPGILLMITSQMTGQIGSGDGLYFIIVGAMIGLKDTALLMLLALFVNALLSVGILIRSKMARDALKQRFPFLPAASAVLICMLVR